MEEPPVLLIGEGLRDKLEVVPFQFQTAHATYPVKILQAASAVHLLVAIVAGGLFCSKISTQHPRIADMRDHQSCGGGAGSSPNLFFSSISSTPQ